MATSTFRYVTYIRTTPAELWHALTTNEAIRQYWFGISADSTWEAGTSWRFAYDGRLMDSGEILESVPRKRLVRSWVNEWKPAFKAEGSSLCTYELEPLGACVRLTVTHSLERPDSRFIAAVSQAWPMCIANLKSLLETGSVALTQHPGHSD
jgi:uncharacterized protein YndB with AHSA1/START domain